MKVMLPPLGAPGDPFGDEGRIAVDVSGGSAIAISSFKFAPNEFLLPAVPALPIRESDPLGDGPRAASTGFVKVNLVSSPRDAFAGLGDNSAAASSTFRMAPMEKRDDYFTAFGPERAAVTLGTFTKSAEGEFHKFTQFAKLQETDDGDVIVYGIATHEQPDSDREICHYPTAKRAYEDWSVAAASRTSAAGQEVSLGPIRLQHSTEAAGKAVKIDYNDDAKEIRLGSIPINDEVRKQLQAGFYTGYSQGGSYAWRKCADCNKSLSLQQANNYCPDCKKSVPVLYGLKRLSEVSYVDSPCSGVGFDYVKQDGTSRFVNFAKRASVGSDGMRILDTTRISRKIWKCTVEIGGHRRTVVCWPDGALVA